MRAWLLSLLLVLTPLAAGAEEGYVQVYLTEAEALRTVMPEAVKVERRVIRPTVAQRTALERHLGRKLPETAIPYFVGTNGTQVAAYAWVLNEVGKHDPITFVVAINPDVTVRDVAVMVFRERRGDGVRRRRFLAQFPGRNANDRLMLNRDILPLTGSTMSSVAVSAGVKRALAMTKYLLQGQAL